MIAMMFPTLAFSVLPVVFPATEFTWAFLSIPWVTFLPVISFPFYLWTFELIAPEVLRNHIIWIHHSRIYFLTAEITSIPEYEIRNGVFMHHDLEMVAVIAFSLFFVFNIMGALLGYWIGKNHRTQFFDSKKWLGLCGLIGVCILALSFVIFDVISPLPRERVALLPYKVLAINLIGGIDFWFDIILLEILVLPIMRKFKEWVKDEIARWKYITFDQPTVNTILD